MTSGSMTRERGTRVRMTTSGENILPLWTPDGQRLLFSSFAPGMEGIYSISADGTGEPEPFLSPDASASPHSWSPDGRHLALIMGATEVDIWVWARDDGASPFLTSRFLEESPRFSPDGRWLAYSSDESGRPEVYVQPFPGPGGKLVISTDGGREPVWSPDGRELFYRNGFWMMAVPIQTEPAFQAGTPRVLFERRSPTATSSNYDVSPDGQRFVMIGLDPESRQSSVHVVLNWFDELQRLVPTP